MQPPIREYTNDVLQDFIKQKDHKMQRAERLTNLLEVILFTVGSKFNTMEAAIIQLLMHILMEKVVMLINVII